MVYVDRTQVRSVIANRNRWSIAFVALLLMVMASACVRDEPFEDPPDDFQEADLVGAWEAHYDSPGTGIDRIVFKEDGTFQQVYDSLESYTFATPWNHWSVERRPEEDTILIHLEGARFYDEGRQVAEKDGISCRAFECNGNVRDLPYGFMVPISEEPLEMVGELVLAVRSSPDAPRGMVLKHMLLGVDDLRSSAFYFVEEP